MSAFSRSPAPALASSSAAPAPYGNCSKPSLGVPDYSAEMCARWSTFIFPRAIQRWVSLKLLHSRTSQCLVQSHAPPAWCALQSVAIPAQTLYFVDDSGKGPGDSTRRRAMEAQKRITAAMRITALRTEPAALREESALMRAEAAILREQTASVRREILLLTEIAAVWRRLDKALAVSATTSLQRRHGRRRHSQHAAHARSPQAKVAPWSLKRHNADSGASSTSQGFQDQARMAM